jgi:hypothetical protein
MHLKGKKIFTGKMQISNGWEIRPFAVQSEEGTYSPGLSAREHRAGSSTGRMITLEPTCADKEEAIAMALAQSHLLARAACGETGGPRA